MKTPKNYREIIIKYLMSIRYIKLNSNIFEIFSLNLLKSSKKGSKSHILASHITSTSIIKIQYSEI